MGITLAIFESAGTSPDSKDIWWMIKRGLAITSATSISTLVMNSTRDRGLVNIQLMQLVPCNFKKVPAATYLWSSN